MATKTRKLHEVIAVEKGIKERSATEMAKVQSLLQHPDFFTGHQKKYQPKDESGERYPDDFKRVQVRAQEVLEGIAEYKREVMDIEATKDLTNTVAKADIVLDGQTIASGVPATTLLYLEKELVTIQQLIGALPTLDPAHDWTKDENVGLYRTAPQQTHRTAKVQKPIVLYEATGSHPAQTQLIVEDIIVGHWQSIQVSGAMTMPDKLALYKKTAKLVDAVKSARERANSVEAAELQIGKAIFDYLLGVK